MSTKHKNKLNSTPAQLINVTPNAKETINNSVQNTFNTKPIINTTESVKEESSLTTPDTVPKISYEYKVIVTRDNIDVFQTTITEHLNNGWELSGGVSCAMYADSYSAVTIWSQAVCKKTTN